MELRLNYGEGMALAEFPDLSAKNIKGKSEHQVVELQTRHIATLQKPAEIINQALDKPLGCYPFNQVFRGARNVLIVTSAAAELSGAEHYLPLLCERLQRLHVPKEEIRILAVKAAAAEENKSALQSLPQPGAPVFYHEPRDHKALEYVGLTRRGTPIFVNRLLLEADHVIICGSVSHHPFAGYEGGPRLIIPGCAGDETIRRYYAHAVDWETPCVHPRCRNGVIEGNPLQEDAREAFRFITTNFLLHTIWNDRQQLIGAVAGEPLQAFAAGCRALDDMFQVPVAQPTTLAIVGCGGFPTDRDFCMAHAALHRAAPIVRSSGVIILVAECRNGLGSEVLRRWCDEIKMSESASGEQKNDWLKSPAEQNWRHQLFHENETAALVAFSTLQKTREIHVVLVSALEPALVQRLGLIPARSLQEALAIAEPWLPDIFSAVVIYNGALAAPNLK